MTDLSIPAATWPTLTLTLDPDPDPNLSYAADIASSIKDRTTLFSYFITAWAFARVAAAWIFPMVCLGILARTLTTTHGPTLFSPSQSLTLILISFVPSFLTLI